MSSTPRRKPPGDVAAQARCEEEAEEDGRDGVHGVAQEEYEPLYSRHLYEHEAEAQAEEVGEDAPPAPDLGPPEPADGQEDEQDGEGQGLDEGQGDEVAPLDEGLPLAVQAPVGLEEAIPLEEVEEEGRLVGGGSDIVEVASVEALPVLGVEQPVDEPVVDGLREPVVEVHLRGLDARDVDDVEAHLPAEAPDGCDLISV